MTNFRRQILSVAAVATLLLPISIDRADAAMVQVYGNNFDGGETFGAGVSGGFSGAGGATASPVGFVGLGFTGNMFRNDSSGNPQSNTILTLNGLQAHDSVDLSFLLGIIDSWDGLGSSFGADALNITLDGASIFSEVFANAGGSQTFSPGGGVITSSGTDLGFSSGQYWGDQTLNMGLLPAMSGIAHTGSSLALRIFASGPYWQGGLDESWGIDNVGISVNALTGGGPSVIPLPAALPLFLSGLVGLGFLGRKRRKA